MVPRFLLAKKLVKETGKSLETKFLWIRNKKESTVKEKKPEMLRMVDKGCMTCVIKKLKIRQGREMKEALGQLLKMWGLWRGKNV